VHEDGKPGCVTAAQLREIKFGLTFAPAMALQRFYGVIGAAAPDGSPDIGRLQAGLDELRDGDATAALEILDAPGLVLASHNDPLVPVVASETLGGMARKDGIIWHETGGHLLPLNDPAWCAEAIRGFMLNFSDKR
jgi:pimeloyl-[acyl-carrier protein] methyl ester esterase